MSFPIPDSLQVSSPSLSTGGNSAIAPLTVNFPALVRPNASNAPLLLTGAVVIGAALLLLRKR